MPNLADLFELQVQQGQAQEWLSQYYSEEDHPSSVYKRLLELAIFYQTHFNYDYALMILNHLYQIKPNYRLCLLVGEIYFSLQDFERAYAWLNRIHNSKRSRKAKRILGQVYLAMGHEKAGISLYRQLIKDFPTYAAAYLDLADYYIDAHMFAEAKPYLESLWTYFKRSESLQRTSRMTLVALELEQELIQAEKVTKMITDPNLPIKSIEEAYLFARFYFAIHDYQMALDYAQLAYSFNPDYLPNRHLLLQINYQLGNGQSGLKAEIDWLLDQMAYDDPEIMQLVEIGKDIKYLPKKLILHLLEYLPYLEEAEEAYQSLGLVMDYYLEEDPKHALHFLKTNMISPIFNLDNYYYYAKTFQALGMDTQAVEQYELALASYENQPKLVYDYAKFMYNRGQGQAALDLIKKNQRSFYYTEQVKAYRNFLQKQIENIKQGEEDESE